MKLNKEDRILMYRTLGMGSLFLAGYFNFILLNIIMFFLGIYCINEYEDILRGYK